MDPTRFTTIAHRDHAVLGPVAGEKLDCVLALLELAPGARVLDAGCGKAEALMRLAERCGIEGVGVDPNAEFLAEARAHAFDRGVAGQIRLHEGAMASFQAEPDSFDAALCIGATHAFGDHAAALAALRALVRPGGRILTGEPYWRRKPDAGYLKALGAKAKDHGEHADNVAAGVKAGLVPLYSAAASEDDFDHYEGLYARAVETWCLEHPSDPDVPAARERIRAWREAYLRWGRDTLGFGLYLFQR
jgi:ubiquinone/menaquinone biosynthesis C-methylase UbiE